MFYIVIKSINGQQYRRYFKNEDNALAAMREERSNILGNGVLKHTYTRLGKECYQILEGSRLTPVTYTLGIQDVSFEDE